MVRELLAALGIIRSVELPELRLGDETIVRRRLAADRLQSEVIPALLADPTGELSAFYGLLPLADTVTAEALGLLVGDRIRRVTGRLGGRTSTGARGELGPDGGREVALSLPFIEPGTVTEGGRIDLRLRVLSSADTGESGERGPGIELELPDWEPITFSLGGRTLAFDTTSLPDVLFVGRDGADTGGAGPVEISMEAQPRTDRRLVIGGATGLDLSWPVLRLSLEAEDEADYGVELVSRGSKVAVKAGEGDSFLRALIAGLDFEVEFDLGLEWSRSRGLTLSGTAALENRIALNLALGPLSLTWLDLILALDGDVIRFSTGSELELRFEPFDVTIEGLGAEATLDFASETRNLGFCDLRLVFRPPTRIVLVIESDVVSGGGFVLIDPIAGRYAGGLALDAFGVGISAIVIVDTKLPGDPDGFALFASLGATFPTPIQLGFGFTLIGVGGLLALHRTIDVNELAAALRDGAADSILFPEDIEKDAKAVLAGLDLWFPLSHGTTVIGPVAEIGWGCPTVISAQLGVIVAIPDMIITLLGSVEMLLPTPDTAVLSLRMDVIGAVDVPASTVTVAASLHDSNLLGVFELSGDMGFYARLTDQPLFVLSVGGYHPGWDPPGALPSWLLDLRRVSASIPLGSNVEVLLTNYVAVTSNSFQFGGRMKIIASVEVAFTTYTAEGWFTINVLLIVQPFSIKARATAGVAISAGEKELLGVDLRTRIEGPQPWYAMGRAEFTFLGLDVPFSFDIGDQPGGEPRDTHPVAEDVTTAVTPPDGWVATDSGDSWGSSVVLSDERPEGLWVRPDQLVEMRQSVAPLNRTMTAFGEYIPDPDRIDATDVTLGGQPVASPKWIDDWFAPAQFDFLDDTAKLSSPSYELMTAGVQFGGAAVLVSVAATECTTVSRVHEESVWPKLQKKTSTYDSPATAARASRLGRAPSRA